MFGITQVFLFVFGAFSIIGGLIGYVKAKSLASLIAGGISGLLLLVCAFELSDHPTGAAIAALVISLLLAGRFVPAFLKKKVWMPAGLMSILSAVSIILTALLLLGFH